jgi:hypothetical protein
MHNNGAPFLVLHAHGYVRMFMLTSGCWLCRISLRRVASLVRSWRRSYMPTCDSICRRSTMVSGVEWGALACCTMLHPGSQMWGVVPALSPVLSHVLSCSSISTARSSPHDGGGPHRSHRGTRGQHSLQAGLLPGRWGWRG